MMMKMKSAICVLEKKVMMFQVLTAKVVFLSFDRSNTELLMTTNQILTCWCKLTFNDFVIHFHKKLSKNRWVFYKCILKSNCLQRKLLFSY